MVCLKGWCARKADALWGTEEKEEGLDAVSYRGLKWVAKGEY